MFPQSEIASLNNYSIMENRKISSYADLKLAINEINYNRLAKEEKIKKSVDNVKSGFQRIFMFRENVKSAIHNYELYRHPLKTVFKRGFEFFRGKVKEEEPKKKNIIATILEDVLAGFNK